MKIKSPDFGNGGTMPERCSQYDANRSPALEFIDVPAAARALVLIVDDPDAPRGLFTHLVAFDIDPDARGFPAGEIPRAARLGNNSYGRAEYAGPRPPEGEHRYFFRLYALDARLGLPPGASRPEVERMMAGHVIAHAEVMARYAAPVDAR